MIARPIYPLSGSSLSHQEPINPCLHEDSRTMTIRKDPTDAAISDPCACCDKAGRLCFPHYEPRSAY